MLFIYVLQLADVERKEDELESYNREELHIREFVLIAENTIVPYGQIINPEVLGVKVQDERPFADIVAQYDWHYEVAMAVMREESRYNPNAINKRDYHRTVNQWGSYGLFQIGVLHFGNYGINWSNWNNPETNIRAAYLLYKEFGWRIWGPCTDGKVRCW